MPAKRSCKERRQLDGRLTVALVAVFFSALLVEL